MDAERSRKIEHLLQSALKREPGERSAFLARTCGADEELRREVDALLQGVAFATVTQVAEGSHLGPY